MAAVPYPYDRNAHRHIGFFNPTNIVRQAGAWFVMVFTEGVGSQPRGNCLLRTERVDDPSAWRGWDGAKFAVRFADPYRTPTPQARSCQPVGLGALNWPVTSLVRHAPSGAFVASMIGVEVPNAPGQGERAMIAASASWDLVHWSSPSVVREVATPSRFTCGNEVAPVAYPSLLDPNSRDRNFEDVGAAAMLFLTRFNLHHDGSKCSLGLDRDLIRMPVAIQVQ